MRILKKNSKKNASKKREQKINKSRNVKNLKKQRGGNTLVNSQPSPVFPRNQPLNDPTLLKREAEAIFLTLNPLFVEGLRGLFKQLDEIIEDKNYIQCDDNNLCHGWLIEMGMKKEYYNKLNTRIEEFLTDNIGNADKLSKLATEHNVTPPANLDLEKSIEILKQIMQEKNLKEQSPSPVAGGGNNNNNNDGRKLIKFLASALAISILWKLTGGEVPSDDISLEVFNGTFNSLMDNMVFPIIIVKSLFMLLNLGRNDN